MAVRLSASRTSQHFIPYEPILLEAELIPEPYCGWRDTPLIVQERVQLLSIMALTNDKVFILDGGKLFFTPSGWDLMFFDLHPSPLSYNTALKTASARLVRSHDTLLSTGRQEGLIVPLFRLAAVKSEVEQYSRK
jgi:hypothetical protein